jgi:hypothetical protein
MVCFRVNTIPPCFSARVSVGDERQANFDIRATCIMTYTINNGRSLLEAYGRRFIGHVGQAVKETHGLNSRLIPVVCCQVHTQCWIASH